MPTTPEPTTTGTGVRERVPATTGKGELTLSAGEYPTRDPETLTLIDEPKSEAETTYSDPTLPPIGEPFFSH